MHIIAREWQVGLDLLARDPQLTEPRSSLPRSSNIILAQADRFVAVRVYLCRTTAWSSFASSLSRRSLWQKSRGWPRRLREWVSKLRRGRRERDVSSRRLPRVDLRQQAGHSAKPIRAFRPLLPRSKEAFDYAVRTWEQLIGVKSLDQSIEIQSQYAKRVYDK